MPCDGAVSRLTYDGNNVVRTAPDNETQAWTFIHGPGLDDPIMGYRYGLGYVFFLTDGNGRQYAAGDADGYDATDNGYYVGEGPYAGSVSMATTFVAERNAPQLSAGLSFFRNRLYDRATGRWTQEDPIGLAGGLNLYAYAGNNPVIYTDAFGLDECDDIKNQDKKKECEEKKAKEKQYEENETSACEQDIRQFAANGFLHASGISALKALSHFRKYRKAADVASTLAHAEKATMHGGLAVGAAVFKAASNEIPGTDLSKELGLGPFMSVIYYGGKAFPYTSLLIDGGEALYSCRTEKGK